MEVDFTQWWVPAVTMVILGTYVLYSGIAESRLPMPATPVHVEPAAENGSSESASSEMSAAPVIAASGETKKRGFLFRTSWIWGSVLVGAAAQAYLSFLAP